MGKIAVSADFRMGWLRPNRFGGSFARGSIVFIFRAVSALARDAAQVTTGL